MDCNHCLRLMVGFGGNVDTYTLGYNLRVSENSWYRLRTGCREMLTVQNRSEIFHPSHILVVDPSIWAEGIQNLLSEASENIRVVS